MTNKDKREPEYPTELESQFILRLPNDPAKVLKEILKTGEDLKNRLTIQVENDMRHGEVCFDQWNMHAKIVDLPTITESVKTFDKKSFYKTADICQMMVCTEEPDKASTEDESLAKNKKKDPYKVDKKFLWPHGITPPTKNIRRRRFRKTLKKKCVEAPEIEKEVKRLLRADNEAISISWEVIIDDDEQKLIPETATAPHAKTEKKIKSDRHTKRAATTDATNQETSSNVVDIFGGAVSDSDLEEENINVDLDDSHMSAYDTRLSDTNSLLGLGESSSKRDTLPLEFGSHMFDSSVGNTNKNASNNNRSVTHTATNIKCGGISSEEDGDYLSRDNNVYKEDMTLRIEQLRVEVEEMKQRRQKTRLEIEGMENSALRQRFQDILHTLNQDIMYKEMEYQGMITLQNSEDI